MGARGPPSPRGSAAGSAGTGRRLGAAAGLLLLLGLALTLVDPAHGQRRSAFRRTDPLAADPPSAISDDSAALAAAEVEMRRFVPRGSAARYAPTAPPPAPSPPPPSRSSGYRRGRVHQDDATPAAPAAPDAPPPPPAFQSRSRSRTSPTSPSTAPLVTPVASGRRRPEQVEPTAAGRRDPSSGRRRPSSDGGDARGGRSYTPDADSSQTQQQQQPPPPPPLPSPTYRRREGGPTRDSRAREEAATPPPVHAAAGYRPRSRPRNSGLSVVPVTIPPPPSVVTEEAVGGFRPRPEGAASRRRPTPASSPQQDLRQYKATPLEVATSLHPVPPSASAGAPDAKQGAPTGRGFHRFRPQSKENSEERRPDSAHAQVDESDNYPPEFKERINSNAPTKLTRLPSFPSRSRATPLPQDSSNEPKLTTKLRPALSSSIRGPTELRHRLKPLPAVDAQPNALANALDEAPRSRDEDAAQAAQAAVSPQHQAQHRLTALGLGGPGGPQAHPRPHFSPQRPHQPFHPSSREETDDTLQAQPAPAPPAPPAPPPRSSLRGPRPPPPRLPSHRFGALGRRNPQQQAQPEDAPPPSPLPLSVPDQPEEPAATARPAAAAPGHRFRPITSPTVPPPPTTPFVRSFSPRSKGTRSPPVEVGPQGVPASAAAARGVSQSVTVAATAPVQEEAAASSPPVLAISRSKYARRPAAALPAPARLAVSPRPTAEGPVEASAARTLARRPRPDIVLEQHAASLKRDRYKASASALAAKNRPKLVFPRPASSKEVLDHEERTNEALEEVTEGASASPASLEVASAEVSTTEVTTPPSPTPSSSTPPSSAAPLSSPPSSPSTPAAGETTATEAAVSTTHRTSLLGRPRPAYVPLRRPSTRAPLDPSATASPIPRATPTTASRFSARFTASRGNRRGLSTAASQKTETVVTGPDAAFPTSPTKLFPATAVPRHRFSSRIKSTDYILAAVALPPAPLGRQFDDDDDEEESTEETTATTVATTTVRPSEELNSVLANTDAPLTTEIADSPGAPLPRGRSLVASDEPSTSSKMPVLVFAEQVTTMSPPTTDPVPTSPTTAASQPATSPTTTSSAWTTTLDFVLDPTNADTMTPARVKLTTKRATETTTDLVTSSTSAMTTSTSTSTTTVSTAPPTTTTMTSTSTSTTPAPTTPTPTPQTSTTPTPSTSTSSTPSPTPPATELPAPTPASMRPLSQVSTSPTRTGKQLAAPARTTSAPRTTPRRGTTTRKAPTTKRAPSTTTTTTTPVTTMSDEEASTARSTHVQKVTKEIPMLPEDFSFLNNLIEMERQAALQATQGKRPSTDGGSLASRIVQVALERALTSTAMPNSNGTASTAAISSSSSTSTTTTTARSTSARSSTVSRSTTARGTSTRSATPRAATTPRATTPISTTSTSTTPASTTTTSTTTTAPDVEGPLDISLSVPVESDAPAAPAAPASPSTAKPGSKISLWVVPRGEDGDGDAEDEAAKTTSIGQEPLTDSRLLSYIFALARAGNREPPRDPQGASEEDGDKRDGGEDATDGDAAAPEETGSGSHDHRHSAEDAALFTALLGAGGAGHAPTGLQLQILQSALEQGGGGERSKERLAALLAALVVARTREGGGGGGGPPAADLQALAAALASNAAAKPARPAMLVKPARPAKPAKPTKTAKAMPSPSPSTAAADAALLSALLGAGGGHGLGGPFGARPVSSTEQTLRDQLLITELLRAGQQQAPPPRPRPKSRTTTTAAPSSSSETSASESSAPVEGEVDEFGVAVTTPETPVPVTKRQRKRPASTTPRPTDFRGLFGAFQEPPRAPTGTGGEDIVGRDQPLVTAAINVTRAVSQFMGIVIQGAAQSFQSFVRQRTNGLASLFTNWGAGSG